MSPPLCRPAALTWRSSARCSWAAKQLRGVPPKTKRLASLRECLACRLLASACTCCPPGSRCQLLAGSGIIRPSTMPSPPHTFLSSQVRQRRRLGRHRSAAAGPAHSVGPPWLDRALELQRLAMCCLPLLCVSTDLSLAPAARIAPPLPLSLSARVLHCRSQAGGFQRAAVICNSRSQHPADQRKHDADARAHCHQLQQA